MAEQKQSKPRVDVERFVVELIGGSKIGDAYVEAGGGATRPTRDGKRTGNRPIVVATMARKIAAEIRNFIEGRNPEFLDEASRRILRDEREWRGDDVEYAGYRVDKLASKDGELVEDGEEPQFSEFETNRSIVLRLELKHYLPEWKSVDLDSCRHWLDPWVARAMDERPDQYFTRQGPVSL